MSSLITALNAVIDRIQVHATACAGVKYVPAEPVENVGALPAVLVYKAAAEVNAEASSYYRAIVTIMADFVEPRVMPNLATPIARQFWSDFHTKLINDPTLNGACEGGIVFPITDQELGGVKWGIQDAYCTRFTIRVKMRGEAST